MIKFAIPMLTVLLFSTGIAAQDNPPVDSSRAQPYWKRFGDPTLDQLVDRAMSENFDVAAARQRIVQAEAIARQALAPLLPTVSAEGSYRLSSYNRLGSGIDTPSLPITYEIPDTMNNMSAVVKASYLIDIAGKQYATRQAALQDAAASAEDADTQAANLVTLIVQAYYDVVTAKIRIDVIEEQIRNSEQLVSLLETRFRIGTSNALDVLQQRQQLAATKSNLPIVTTLLETAKLQLAALVGDMNTDNLPGFPEKLPELGPTPSETSPEKLMTDRPEIRAAKTRLDALQFREKSAFRALMPSLALSGQVGWMANYGNTFDQGETWNVGAVLSIPIYQGGATRAGLHAARAATAAQENTLNSSVLSAVQKVEIARQTELGQRARLEALRLQQEAAEMTLDEAKSRYLVGLSDYLNVLSSVSSVQLVQLTVVQTERELLSARINLLSAAGGEWTRELAKREGNKK